MDGDGTPESSVVEFPRLRIPESAGEVPRLR
jgi:hypothetical protein